MFVLACCFFFTQSQLLCAFRVRLYTTHLSSFWWRRKILYLPFALETDTPRGKVAVLFDNFVEFKNLQNVFTVRIL